MHHLVAVRSSGVLVMGVWPLAGHMTSSNDFPLGTDVEELPPLFKSKVLFKKFKNAYLKIFKKIKRRDIKVGLVRDLNPGPLAP